MSGVSPGLRSKSGQSASAHCARPCFTPRHIHPGTPSRLSRVDPETFTEADLHALPVMTKTDVMTNWDAIVTDRRLTLADCNAHIAAKLNGTCKDYYYLDEYLVIATGGSSGVRGVFPWGWDEFIEIACATFRYQVRDEPPGTLTGRRLLAVSRQARSFMAARSCSPFRSIRQRR